MEESSADVFLGVEFDGNACTITEDGPAFAATEIEDLDLIISQASETLTIVSTNASDMRIRPKVNINDLDITVAEAHDKSQSERDRTRIAEPPYVSTAQTNYSAEYLDLAENQSQEDHILQPGGTHRLRLRRQRRTVELSNLAGPQHGDRSASGVTPPRGIAHIGT